MPECANCGGCPKNRALVLTEEELEFLKRLAVTPFLPVARRPDSESPVFLEDGEEQRERHARTLQLLALKGLIDLDYHLPLSGFDYRGYEAFAFKGSMALTAEGIEVLELLDVQGIRE